MLTTHTPSAIGPTPNYFVSIYFGWSIFADLLKEIFSELIEWRLFEEVDSLCITKKSRLFVIYPTDEFLLRSRLNLIRKFVNVVYEVMSGYLLLN